VKSSYLIIQAVKSVLPDFMGEREAKLPHMRKGVALLKFVSPKPTIAFGDRLQSFLYGYSEFPCGNRHK